MLIVTDFGQRIQTPWYDIFPPRTVAKLSASEASSRVSEDDQVKASDTSERDYLERSQQQANSYRQLQDSHERQPVTLAQQLMTTPVISLSHSDSSRAAARLMRQHQIHHLPVVSDSGGICGIVSDRSLLPLQADQPIEKVMQRQVLCGQAQTPIREVAEVMLKHRIGALPLIDEHNGIEGIITRHDILKAVMNRAPLELWS